MNYLEWIDQQITKHQTEIARLEIARTVIEDAAKANKLAKPKLNIAKLKPSKWPIVKPRGGARIAGRTRDKIIAAMKRMDEEGHLPATAGPIIEVVRADDDTITAKAIWNAMYNARATGVILREGKLYSLPKEGADVQQPGEG